MTTSIEILLGEVRGEMRSMHETVKTLAADVKAGDAHLHQRIDDQGKAIGKLKSSAAKRAGWAVGFGAGAGGLVTFFKDGINHLLEGS